MYGALLKAALTAFGLYASIDPAMKASDLLLGTDYTGKKRKIGSLTDLAVSQALNENTDLSLQEQSAEHERAMIEGMRPTGRESMYRSSFLEPSTDVLGPLQEVIARKQADLGSISQTMDMRPSLQELMEDQGMGL